MSRVAIRKFDPSTQLRPDATVALIGRRGSGKSTLMKDLLYHMRKKLNFGIAMSPTEDSNGAFGAFMPRACIYSSFTPTALDVLLQVQTRAKRRGKERRVFVLLDDCMYEKSIMNSDNIRETLMNGRHKNIFFINAVQYIMDVPPAARGQTDYVFAMQDNNRDNREKLYKFFFGVFNSFDEFDRAMQTLTNNRCCIVLDNRSHSTDVTDCVFWYRADPNIPNFRLCDDIYYELDRRFYYNREEMEDETVMGVGDQLTRGRKSGLFIVDRVDHNGGPVSVVDATNSYTARAR